MNPMIQKLADHFGVKLAERSTQESYAFDGESIAKYGANCVFVDEEEFEKLPFQERMAKLTPELSWSWFKWLDHDLMHEIAHYVCANPEQRDLPEFGLGHIAISGTKYVDEVVDASEGSIQERMVQFLCVYWGMLYDIPSALHTETRDWKVPWEEYLLMKIDEAIVRFKTPEHSWEALIRLHSRGLLNPPF